MAVAPVDLDRVATDWFDLGGIDQDRQDALGHDALARVLVDATRARALAAEETGRIDRFFAGVPANPDIVVAVAIDFQGQGSVWHGDGLFPVV